MLILEGVPTLGGVK